MARCPECGERLPDRQAKRLYRCPACRVLLDEADEDEFEADDAYLQRSRSRSRGESNVALWITLAVGGGVGVVLLLGVVVFLLVRDNQAAQINLNPPPGVEWPGQPLDPRTAGSPQRVAPPGPPAPAGYSVAGSQPDGFRVVLPGTVAVQNQTVHRVGMPPVGWAGESPISRRTVFRARQNAGLDSTAYSVKPTGGRPAGNTPDALWNALADQESIAETTWSEVERKTPTELGGRPALEVRVFENRDRMGGGSVPFPGPFAPPVFPDNPNMPEPMRQAREQARRQHEEMNERFAEQRRQSAEALQKTAKYSVYFVTADEQRVYVVKVERIGGYADPEALKAITDSYQFVP